MFMWFYLNESNSEDAVLAIRNSRVSDFRHSHIISAAGLTRTELINVLVLARKQWPSAKILGISELGLENLDQRIVSSGRLCPSDAMNSIRRELSDLPSYGTDKLLWALNGTSSNGEVPFSICHNTLYTTQQTCGDHLSM